MKAFKRISALLLAVMLLASFTVCAFAEDNGADDYISEVKEGEVIDTNYGSISDNHGTVKTNVAQNGLNGSIIENFDNGTVVTNNGHILKNSGTVGKEGEADTGNYGTITYNRSGGTVTTNQAGGTVTTNEAGGTVTTNNGTVGEVDADGKPVGNSGNYGTVDTNNGTVVVNQAGGSVYENQGNITDNYGTVEDNSGTVGMNYDTVVNNSGTVTNMKGYIHTGTVINNFGDGKVYVLIAVADAEDPKPSSAQNQFTYNAELDLEDAEADKLSDDSNPRLYDGKYWIKDGTDDGSVTVRPTGECTDLETPIITDNGTTPSVYSYNKNNDNSYTFSFTQLFSNIKIKITGVKPTPTPDPQPDPPTPAPKPTVGPVAVFTYKLSFDLDGGVMPDGKTELEMKCSSGQRIKLPEAPTKEGFTFAGWETTIRGKTVVFEAGAKFTVTAAKTFVALWEEA